MFLRVSKGSGTNLDYREQESQEGVGPGVNYEILGYMRRE